MTHPDFNNTLSIRLVWPFEKLARQCNRHDVVERLPRDLELDPAEFRDPDTRVPLQRAVNLLVQVIAMTGTRDLGLLAAQCATSENSGVVEYMARFKPTLGEALLCSIQYVRLLADGANVSVEVRGELVIIQLWFDGGLMMHESVYEFCLAILLRYLQRLSGLPELAPTEVHLMHPQPCDVTVHRRVFRCMLRFNSPVTLISLPAEILRIPMANAEPDLSVLLERQATAMLEELPDRGELKMRVKALLDTESTLVEPTAHRMAQRLGIGVRTLARRLGDEGTSFRVLLEETRRQRAMRELAQTQRRIYDIARELGFSSSQSFHRAFRRWTGSSAASYRAYSRRRTDSCVRTIADDVLADD